MSVNVEPVESVSPETSVIDAPEAVVEAEGEASPEALEGVVADPKASKAEKKEAEKLLKKYKLKVDGKEEDFEIDLSNEEEVRKHLQLSKVAQKRMQERAELEKSMGKFFDLLKQDPKQVLSHPEIGVDLKAFAQSLLEEAAAEEAKTPEQRELEKYKKELEDIKAKQEQEAKEREAGELKRLEDEQEKLIISEMKDAFQEVNLPYSPRAVRYMAEYMKLANDNNIPVTAAEIAPIVKKQMIKDYQEMLRSAPDELLEEFIDKDVSTRLHKNRISKAKTAPPTANQVKPTGNNSGSKKEQQIQKNEAIKNLIRL